jgi:hypothetical protein
MSSSGRDGWVEGRLEHRLARYEDQTGAERTGRVWMGPLLR